MQVIIKVLVVMFSFVILFACSGEGDEASTMVSNKQTSSERREKASRADYVPASGWLSDAINSRFWQCMDDAWELWYEPSRLPGKYAQCVGEGYRVLFEESGIGDQLLDRSNGHRWLPEKGRATIGENFILVQFKFDDAAINFFKTKFVGSNTRLPIGLEIDVSPIDNDVFRKAGSVILLTSSGDNVSHEAGIFLDTTEFDQHPGYGAVIRNPHKLQAGIPYAVIFHTEGAPWYDPEQGDSLVKASGDVRLIFQVSIDKPKANAMIAAYDAGDHELNGFSSDGNGGGFSYFVTASDPFNEMNLPGESRICWYAKLGDDKNCTGGNPINQPLAETVIAAGGAVSQDAVSNGDAILQSGTVIMPGQGPGGYPLLADVPVEVPPDFVTNRTWLTTPWGTETYTFGLDESFDTKAQSKNDGDGPCVSGEIDTITVHFYLSKGYKEDVHSGDGAWRRLDSAIIQCDNLEPGETHTETKNTNISEWITEPGIYNVVACTDHPQDDHNNGGDHVEKHESNNCSTEAVFEVLNQSIVNVPNVDFSVSGFAFLQTPVYAGDYVRLGAWITNQGTVNATNDIRSSYTVSCNGGSEQFLTDDGTMASTLSAGASAWEEILTPVLMPNVAGECTLYFHADYQGNQTETDEENNTATLTVTLLPRPAPNLVITKFQDESGCCTTNTGSRIKPDIWVRNDGPVAPGANVTVIYHIASPVATNGQYILMGYGSIRPDELPPGGTDEDYMDAIWTIPKTNAWKYQWHSIRGCLRADGGTPVGDPNTEVCGYYARYSKK